MHGIGSYQPNLAYQDGIYTGLLCKVVADKLEVEAGLAMAGRSPVEVKAADFAGATAIEFNAATMSPAGGEGSEYVVYLNPVGAKNAAGVELARITVGDKEADTERLNINGTVGGMQGRSLPLARVTVAGGVFTVVDNTERMKIKNIPAAAHGKSMEDTSHPHQY